MTQQIFNKEIAKQGFNLDGMHLVAASAGTGKTYNVQNIYARLVQEKGLAVSNILVMSFTEEATRELRDRIQKVLRLLHLYWDQGVEAVDEKERARVEMLAQCARSNVGGTLAQKRVELALLEFDQAAISTIHGFCNRILSRYAFEAGREFQPELATEGAGGALAQLARDWWRTQYDQAPEEFRSQLTLGTLVGYVQTLGSKADGRLEPQPDCSTPNGYLLAAAQKIVEQYEAKRATRETQTFDDLLRGVRDALRDPKNGPSLACRLRQEFQAALIDEFQDTDPVQYEIIRRIFIEGNLPVFLVGDPKQAIYSFRGGDIFTYRQAVLDKKLEGHKFYLDQNFRSTPRLMAAVNAIFHDHEGTSIFGDSTIDYPVDITPSPIPALEVNGAPDPKPFRVIRVDGAKELLSQVVVAEVVKLLNDYRGVLKPKDVAILVNKHADAATLCGQLKDQGVPCVTQKSGNVFTTDGKPSRMARDFQLVLQAMAGQGGVKAVRNALLTPFVGLSPVELQNLSQEGFSQWVERFQECNDLWWKRGFAAAIRHLEEAGRRDGIGLRERLARLADGERRLADYGQMLELAFTVIQERGTAPDILLDWLTERLRQGPNESETEEYARGLESEADAVKIMTLHVSKGLQFPVVFIADCNVDAWKQTGLATFHDEEDGALFLAETEEARQRATEEERQEKRRQLYVAMTRAERRTVAFYQVSSRTSLHEPLSGLLENARRNHAGDADADGAIQWTQVSEAPAEMPVYQPEANDTALEAAAPIGHRFDLRPSKGSYSSLNPARDHDANDEGLDFDKSDGGAEMSEGQGGDGIFQIPGGMRIGNCWHSLLEQIPFDADAQELETAARGALQAYGFSPEAAPAEGAESYLALTVRMLQRTLAWPLEAPDGTRFTLRDVPWADRLSEQEFSFSSRLAVPDTKELRGILLRHWGEEEARQPFLKSLDNWERELPRGFFTGAIDLLFRHGGYYYVLDWKSNVLGGRLHAFGRAGIQAEMAKHAYFLQYLLYSAVLHRHLRKSLGERYSWERNFGGIRYCFLRGMAAGGEAPVFMDRPSEALLDDLCMALGMEAKA